MIHKEVMLLLKVVLMVPDVLKTGCIQSPSGTTLMLSVGFFTDGVPNASAVVDVLLNNVCVILEQMLLLKMVLIFVC